MKVLNALTQERLKELMHYEPETGVFTRLTTITGTARAGSIAGSNSYGYIQITVDKRLYRAHRLAWLYMTGEFPDSDIDHINGIKNCNVWTNLRACTRQQNTFNIGITKRNTSGFKGVSWHKKRKKWTAAVKVGGKAKTLGQYLTLEEAANAYEAYAKRHHGDFFRSTK